MQNGETAITYVFDDVKIYDLGTGYWRVPIKGVVLTPTNGWYNLFDSHDVRRLPEQYQVLAGKLVSTVPPAGVCTLTVSRVKGVYLSVKHLTSLSEERDKLMRRICRIVGVNQKKFAAAAN